MAEQQITVRRLSTGYYHVRGIGPCNWAQPPTWPCDGLVKYASPEASGEFIRAAFKAMDAGEGPIDG